MKILKKVIMICVISIIALFSSSTSFANSLVLNATSVNGKIQLNWENPYGDAKNYPYAYRLFKSTDNGTTYKTVSMWNENDEVKVLNIYPQVNYNVEYHFKDGTKSVMPKSAAMKIWMEGGTMIENGIAYQFDNYGRDIVSGKQLIKVDSVTYGDYNNNPNHYLKDGDGNYKYDVIAFGTWDANNWIDLTQESANAAADFIASGRGAFFGHDTLYRGTSPIAFNTLAQYVGVTQSREDVTQYTGEVGSSTGRGAIESNKLSQVKITSHSSLTSYPWNIGDVGTMLTVPGAHNLQAANGQILMRFHHNTYTSSDNVPENFFLTLYNNTAMSQTGHSLGNSTDDERKILANTLFYLKQVSSAEHATDTEIIDNTPPDNLSANIIGCTSGDDYQKKIRISARDRGTSYKYYLEAIPQIQGHGVRMQSNTISQESFSGIDSFWYTITGSNSSITKPSVSDANWHKTNNGNSYDFITNTLDYTKPQYIHYFAKDVSGNISEEKIYAIPTNNAPVITIAEKAFYENQYTQDKWNEIRSSGLIATDTEDGVITSKVQLVSDTTKLDTPGIYKVTYKVKDSACLTTIKENRIIVKFNNPPVVKTVNKTFYEGQYSSAYWKNTLRMKDTTATDVEDGSLTKIIRIVSDNVDVSRPGNYSVVYGVTDAYGKTGKATSSVTVLFNNPPVITAKNQKFYEDEITLKEWKEKRLEIVKATDVEDGNITNKIEIIRDNVNPTIPDTYQIVYKVIDQYGKSNIKTVDVLIKYNNPPKITGNNKKYMEHDLTKEKWSKERIKDIIASDIEDGNITSKIKVISDNVKINVPGFYHVGYSVIDAYGKKAEKTIEVEIVYNQLPLIIAENKNYYENELTNDQWIKSEIMKDVSSLDTEDGDLTSKIAYTHNVDVTKPGVYEVTYTVTDSGGKKTEKTIDVTIKSNHQPVLDIFAENKRFVEGEYTIEQWINELRMENVSANDYEDNDLTDKIEIIKDNVDPSKSGVYEVTYKVTDKYGKSKETTIKVTVEANNPPVIHATDRWFTTKDKITEKELLKKVIAYDDIDGEITEKVKIKSNEVKEGQVGEYKVIYTVKDKLGKEGFCEVTVHIAELDPTPQPPVDPPVPPSDENSVILANGKKYGLVTLDKVMEHSEQLNGTDYGSVVFGVYTDEDITWKGNVILNKDSLVGIIRLNETQKGSAKVYHEGNYYVKEIAVNEQYVISNQKYTFMFKYN